MVQMTTQSSPTRSLLPKDIFGVMYIAGQRGVGKTYLSSQADTPPRVEMWDFENKGEGVHNQLQFARYLPLNRAIGGVTYAAMMNAVDGILPTTTTVILDNAPEMEKALRVEAKANAKKYADKYGLNADNIVAGRFGGASAAVNPMISDLCAAIHAKGVQLIIATAHLSQRWSTGGPIPNKFNVKGADRWQELSILSLILYRGSPPHIEVPDALVQKEQLGTIQAPNIDELSQEDFERYVRGELGHVVSRRLPFKITNCTFQKIRAYLHNPADIHNPKPGEMPTLEESDPFSDKLSKEQFEVVRDMARVEAAREEEAQQQVQQLSVLQSAPPPPLAPDVLLKVRTILMADAQAGPPMVLQKLQEQGMDVPMPAIVQAILEVKKELPL